MTVHFGAYTPWALSSPTVSKIRAASGQDGSGPVVSIGPDYSGVLRENGLIVTDNASPHEGNTILNSALAVLRKMCGLQESIDGPAGFAAKKEDGTPEQRDAYSAAAAEILENFQLPANATAAPESGEGGYI